MDKTWIWILGGLLFGCFYVGLQALSALARITDLIRLNHQELLSTVEAVAMDLHGIAADTLAIHRRGDVG